MIKSREITGELHLLLLWEKARVKEECILEDVKKHLKILECYDIGWTPSCFFSNISRFYGVKLGTVSGKIKECGCGRFLLLTVWDPEPNYHYADTSRGTEFVNNNIFALKQKYRSWTGGGSKIHSTNNPQETDHDITLLLGICSEDYLKTVPEYWDGTVKKIDRDVFGCYGWKSLEDIFYVLNHTINYVVLRNYECLPGKFCTEEHGDIDLLVDDADNTALILNARKVYQEKHRVHYCNKVNHKNVYWDIRHVGDNYYCIDWEIDMLTSRVLLSNGLYALNNKHYFYSLIYHAVIHKRKIASDYYEKVKSLLPRQISHEHFSRYPHLFDAYYALLKKFMQQRGYSFTRPDDKSVFFNDKIFINKAITAHLTAFHITEIEPIWLILYGRSSGYSYFTGTREGERLFIKWGGVDNSCLTEYRLGKKLYAANPINFVKPIMGRCDGERKWIALEYVEGKTLEEILDTSVINEEEQERFITDLHAIAMTLRDTGIIHRDIRPANCIIESNGHIKLIDYQFSKRIREKSHFDRHHVDLLAVLGDGFSPRSFVWDDMYSIVKMMRLIGVPNTVKQLYNEVELLVGSMRTTLPLRYRLGRKLRRLLATIVPIRSWRRRLRKGR